LLHELIYIDVFGLTNKNKTALILYTRIMKFLKIHILLFLFIVVGNFLQAQSNDMYIVLLAGQSNMAGRGVIRPAIDTISYPNIFSLTRDSVWVRAKNPLHYDKPEAAVGMGISFAHELSLKLGGNVKIGLVPCAAGGTTINQWLSNSYFPVTGTTTGNYYLYDNLIKRAKKAAKSGTIIGLLWHQGESDAIDAYYPTYQNNLKTFFQKVRIDLKNPNLPIIAGELGRYLVSSSTYPRWDSINNIINRLKITVPFYDVASSSELVAQDGVHFTSASQVTLGTRYADALYQMVFLKSAVSNPEESTFQPSIMTFKNGIFHIDNSNAEKISCQVYDSMGREIIFSSNNYCHTIPIFKKGIFLIQIKGSSCNKVFKVVSNV